MYVISKDWVVRILLGPGCAYSFWLFHFLSWLCCCVVVAMAVVIVLAVVVVVVLVSGCGYGGSGIVDNDSPTGGAGLHHEGPQVRGIVEGLRDGRDACFQQWSSKVTLTK